MQRCIRHIVGSGDRRTNEREAAFTPSKNHEKGIIAVKERLSGKLAGKFKRRNSELSVVFMKFTLKITLRYI